MAAKRYTDADRGSTDGITLLLAHGAGSPLLKAIQDKEQWEPTLDKMFEAQHRKVGAMRIREAWAFDWQNHGDSALINRDALHTRPRPICKHSLIYVSGRSRW
ncbi:hypothetical protein HWV62_11027 [Athelia sp. TMB]|nr:hypothetical protein HWV62_11027 [Athelia sp. TMB]